MEALLSLCDYSGVWSKPYLDSGSKVIQVDIAHPPGINRVGNLTRIGIDIRDYKPSHRFTSVIAAPPCTCFCRPAARWWSQQDREGRTQGNIELLVACLRLCKTAAGWWAMENPPGRHRKLIPELGPPAWQYQPWEYGDPWIKQTYIWGSAVKPAVTRPVEPKPATRTPNGRLQGRIARMSSSHKRQREQTPGGFAAAFFAANPLTP